MKQLDGCNGVTRMDIDTQKLLEKQFSKLKRHHYLILYWAAQAEVAGKKYNITNVFDDLKAVGATRTKQNAVSYVEVLDALCLIEVREESNRKNLYITEYGEQALEQQARRQTYQLEGSAFLGGKK